MAEMQTETSVARPTIGPADRAAGWVVRHLRSVPTRSIRQTIAFEARAADRTLLLARAFYAIGLVWVVQDMGRWPALQRATTIAPQWPASWLDRSGPGRGISWILLAYGASAALVALAPAWRSARLVYAVALLEYMAVVNGFGKVNHAMHAWLFVSAFLVWLPTRSRWDDTSTRVRHHALNVLWSCQVIVLFFYTLTGLWKVAYAVRAFGNAQIGSYDLRGFSLIVGNRILGTNQDTILGEFFVRNQPVGWLLFNGTMYLEAASLLVAFRPRLHRIWGAGLIAFHFGTQLAMGFTFTPNIAVVGLLFLCSPLAPDRVSVRDAVLDLPGVHLVHRWWQRRGRATDPVPTPAA